MLTRDSPEAGSFIPPAWFCSAYMVCFLFRDPGTLEQRSGTSDWDRSDFHGLTNVLEQ